MTISSTVSRISYVGDGSSVNFPVPWLFYANTDLLVLLNGVVQTYSANYTVSGAGLGSGTVTMTVAPAAAANLQIIMNPPQTQTANFVDGTDFPSATLDQVNDRAIQVAQRLQDQISRALRAPDGDAAPAMLLPIAATRASTALGFDVSGNVTVLQSLPSGTLSQASIGQFLYPTMTGEVGVVSPWYPYGNVLRYGADATGVAECSANCQNADRHWGYSCTGLVAPTYGRLRQWLTKEQCACTDLPGSAMESSRASSRRRPLHGALAIHRW